MRHGRCVRRSCSSGSRRAVRAAVGRSRYPAMRNYSAAADATAAEWQAMVGVNLVGMSNYCRSALPALRQSGTGSIVNVSSCYAVTGRKGMALYDATKAAQLAYTRSLAFEEAAHGVRANAVCPG